MTVCSPCARAGALQSTARWRSCGGRIWTGRTHTTRTAVSSSSSRAPRRSRLPCPATRCHSVAPPPPPPSSLMPHCPSRSGEGDRFIRSVLQREKDAAFPRASPASLPKHRCLCLWCCSGRKTLPLLTRSARQVEELSAAEPDRVVSCDLEPGGVSHRRDCHSAASPLNL